MPTLLCTLSEVLLVSDETDPFRRALQAQGRSAAGPQADDLRDGTYVEFMTGRVGESEYARHLRARLAWSGSDPDLVALFDEAPADRHLGIVEVLRSLRDAGWALVVLENANPWQERARRAVYGGCGLLPDLYLGSWQVGRTLSDPRFFGHVRRRLGVGASTALFLDRDPVVVAAAQRAGVTARVYRTAEDFASAVQEFDEVETLLAPAAGPPQS